MHVDEEAVSQQTFARELKERANYTVGLFGKYLTETMQAAVPSGFDAWLSNGGGTYMAPKFQFKNVHGLIPGLESNSRLGCGWSSENARDPAHGCWQTPPGSYSTAVIGNASVAWIKRVIQQNPAQPFFAYIAYKAAHDPFNPAPWYQDHWDPAWPSHEPRGNRDG